MTDQPRAIAVELAVARRQRDYLGDQLRRRIEAAHAARVARGEIDAAAMAAAIGQEIGAIKAACDQIGATP